MEKQRIVVAMSGGVDSSVVAALAKEAGHEVIGITLQLYDHGQATGRKGSCCAGQDIHDARRVARVIGIPHYVLDYESRFAAAVMRPFAESYASGRTPVPCAACNQEIKFKDLLNAARELGASALATGHYVERRDGPEGPALHRGADAARDQSYFLFAVTREQLAYLRFPVGGMRKDEVRAIARARGLPVAAKADSQDICFVPEGRYSDVVQRLQPGAAEPGDIVHADGRWLGRHNGTIHFTIGQRRGLGIACGEPLYVIGLDPARRRVIVGPRERLATWGVLLDGVNWLGAENWPPPPGEARTLFVRVRSSQPPVAASLLAGDRVSRARVIFAQPEYGVAPGQACVFYSDGGKGARLLGGGWIARTSPPHTEHERARCTAAGLPL